MLWLDGLFFTLTFVVILAALGFAVSAVPGWLVPAFLVAALVSYTLIGASVLRLQGLRRLKRSWTNHLSETSASADTDHPRRLSNLRSAR